MKSSTVKSKVRAALAATLGAVAFTVAPASAQAVDYNALFVTADLDLSGSLNFQEFSATLKPGTSLKAASNKFDSADWNFTDLIELREFLVFFKVEPKPTKAEIVFILADGNANGILTYEEYDYYIILTKEKEAVVNIRRNYLRADGDGDGVVTRAEFIAFGNGDYDRTKISLFALADDGDDGVLSYLEYGYTLPRFTAEAKVIAKFDKLDKNNDDVLTRSEWNPGVPKGSEL